jgi:phosphonopyruvate decarboxylase
VTNTNVRFAQTALDAGYRQSFFVRTEDELRQTIIKAVDGPKPCLIEVACAVGSRPDLGRPTTTPQQNRDDLMCWLNITEG